MVSNADLTLALEEGGAMAARSTHAPYPDERFVHILSTNAYSTAF